MFPPLRIRRFQFRLTTLLGLMAAIAVCAAVYGARLRAEQRQEQAFREITARGGFVYVYRDGISVYFQRLPPTWCHSGVQGVLEPTIDPRPFGNDDCLWLEDVQRLHSVHFAGSQVSHEQAIVFQGGHPHCRVGIRPFDD